MPLLQFPGLSAGAASFISLVFNGSTPYVSYRDNFNGDKVTVMKFDGTNWVGVGNAGFSAGDIFFTSLAIYGGTPYVAYSDGGNAYKATVMKFDGANWVTVGGAGFSAADGIYISLAFAGNIPCVAFSDNGIGNSQCDEFWIPCFPPGKTVEFFSQEKRGSEPAEMDLCRRNQYRPV